MKKIFMFMLVMAVAVSLTSTGCNKKAPAEPSVPATKTITSTATNTPTITVTFTATPTSTVTPTVTPTITPNAGAHLYDFEDGTVQGWHINTGAAATSSSNSASLPHNGSYSLFVGCTYAAGIDTAQVKRSYDTMIEGPVNLSGKTLTFFVYISPAMAGAGNFYPIGSVVNYAGTTLALADMSASILPSGWNQATWSIPATADYELIKDIYIGLKDDSGGSYNAGFYMDDIAW